MTVAQLASGNGRAQVPVLQVEHITAGYGDTVVLNDVGFEIAPGSVTALLGPNGAGKTTLLRTIAGLIRAKAGRIVLGADDVTTKKAHVRARRGLCLIPEGRGVYPTLTVADNLRLATPPWISDNRVDRALDAFPVLRERLGQRAGTMSGGQQQMLALSRCFVSDPTVVLLDEVSMGLAPRIVEEIFGALQRLAEGGTALLLVEQYIHRALAMADTVHLISRGSLVFSGPPSALAEESVMRGYLGADLEVPASETPPSA